MNAPINQPPKKPHDYLSWAYWFLFLLVVPVIAILMANKPTQVSLPILKQSLPPYHIITSKEVSAKQVEMNAIVGGTVRNLQDLIGHYTLVSVAADQPVLENQLGPMPASQSLIVNTLAAAIPANGITTFGGNLRAGDVVSLAVVPLSNAASSSQKPTLLFARLLVLDVKPGGSQPVIVLAIPADQWIDYLTQTHDMTIVLARQVT